MDLMIFWYSIFCPQLGLPALKDLLLRALAFYIGCRPEMKVVCGRIDSAAGKNSEMSRDIEILISIYRAWTHAKTTLSPKPCFAELQVRHRLSVYALIAHQKMLFMKKHIVTPFPLQIKTEPCYIIYQFRPQL